MEPIKRVKNFFTLYLDHFSAGARWVDRSTPTSPSCSTTVTAFPQRTARGVINLGVNSGQDQVI